MKDDDVERTNGNEHAIIPIPKRRGRSRVTSTPLARPQAPIHILVTRIQDYLYFPTPDPLYVILGCIAANMIKGDPVWIMMIGAPSAGKTVLFNALAGLSPDLELADQKLNIDKRVHIVGAFRTEGALLSGTGKKEVVKSATGGLLRQLGTRGMIVMKDFTPMLTGQRDSMGPVIAAMRDVFDGRYSRPLGTDGGKEIVWEGKLGFLGASTPVIDRHTAMIGDLGERWMYYRYPVTDGYGESIKALGQDDPDRMKEDMKNLIAGFFEELGLSWRMGEELEDRRGLTDKEKNRIYAMAALVCASRSGVPRDWRTGEIVDIAVRESTARISKELGQFYLGLERIGLGDERERWRLLGKLAMDSLPQLKATVLMLVASGRVENGQRVPVNMKRLREETNCGRRAVGAAVEDLRIHGVVRVMTGKAAGAGAMAVEGHTKKKDEVTYFRVEDEETMRERERSTRVELSDWAKEQLGIGWAGWGEGE